jgi:hypothetical protein
MKDVIEIKWEEMPRIIEYYVTICSMQMGKEHKF